MIMKSLDKEKIRLLTKKTGIRANSVLLMKKNRYYYILILDNATKIRISSKLACEFL